MTGQPPHKTEPAYERLEPLGAGGQAQVFLARPQHSETRVVWREASGAAESFALRAQLRHPGIVAALDVLAAGALPADVLIEEHIVGPSWAEAPPTPAQLPRMARYLLHAACYLHDHGVAHRDIKPANIILQPSASGPAPVLIDFGLAVHIDQAHLRSGTLGTVAPEVLRGGGDPVRADLFSIGSVLLSAALGREPDPDWSLDPNRLRSATDRCPPAVRALLVGLCSADARDRFASAAEALAALPPEDRTLWTPPESWPYLGDQREAMDLVEAWRHSRRPRLVAILGPTGSGRRTLAERMLRAAGALRASITLFAEVTDEQHPAFETLLHRARAGERILLTTSSADFCLRLTTLLGDDVVRTVRPEPLTVLQIADWIRWLPVRRNLDAARCHSDTAGLPGEVVASLQPSPSEVDATPTPAEVYLAIRDSAVGMQEVADGQAPGPAQLERAVLKGRVLRRRDGTFVIASERARHKVLAAASKQVVQSMHRLAASRASEHRTYHAAAAGDRDALPGCLTELETATIDRLDSRLLQLNACLGRDALWTHPEQLEQLGRRLVVAAHIETAETLLADLTLAGPPPLLSLQAYVLSERGEPERAIEAARCALARADRPVHAHLDLVRALQFVGRLDEALAALEPALASARDAHERAHVRRLESLVTFRLGRAAAAIELGEAALALEHDDARLRHGIEQNLAMMLRHVGDYARAATLFEHAGAGLLDCGDLRGATIVWINSGIAWMDAGEFARSQELRERAMHKCEQARLAQPRDVARAGLGIVLGVRGAWHAARQELRAAAASLEEQGLEREARLARIHEARAVAQLRGGNQGLASLLASAVAAGDTAAAAQAWLFALEAGEPELGALQDFGTDVPALLRGADRQTREALRVELHRRRATTRSIQRLARLAQLGLPLTRLGAARALAQLDGPQRRTWSARALVLGRRCDAPAEQIANHAMALRVTRNPRIHLRRLAHALVELEKLWPVQTTEDEDVSTWIRQMTALREQLAQALASPARQDLEPFLHINRLLAEDTNDDAARYRTILEQAMRLTNAQRGMLVTRAGPGTAGVRLSLQRLGAGETSFAEHPFELSQNLLDEVLETGTPRVTINALADPEWSFATSVVDFQLAAIACVPVRAGDDVLGAMYLDNPLDAGAFPDGAVEMLEAFGTQVSLSLAAARKRSTIARLNEQLSKRLDQTQERLRDAERNLAEVRGKRAVLYQSECMAAVMRKVRRLAATDLPIFVRGETGTGKELVARRLHELSARREGPFISENCSALSAELLESELFGHIAGAFTGATKDKKGLLRRADGGTLFLDEIGDMPLPLQARLLRVLQEGEVRPVGGDAVLPIDVRVVTATHRDIREMVEAKEFREDLYYRIVVAEIALPALRERPEDIVLLANHFLRRYGPENARFSDAAVTALRNHAWPGNVRELESAVRSALVLARGTTLEVDALPATLGEPTDLNAGGSVPTVRIKDLERMAIQEALKRVDGNRAKAAELLGISRSSVFVKIRDYGLS